MKLYKTYLVTLMGLALLAAASLPVHALPVGSPVRTLEDGEFSLSGSIGYTEMDVEDEEVTSRSFFFKGAFEGVEGVTPYLKLGFADLEVGSFEGSLDFAYGGGVLLDLMTQESGSGFRISVDAQVLWSESSEGGTTLDLQESQLSLLGSINTSGTNAYTGIAASFVDLDGGGVSGDENGLSHIFFGVDYFMDYNFYLNAEAHLFGQDTLSIGVGYKF